MPPNTLKIGAELAIDDKKGRAVVTDFAKFAKKMGDTTSLGGLAKQASSDWGSFSAILGQAKSSLGSIPIPATAAASAVAGIGAAAYGTAVELFNLAKQGSDLGKQFASFQAKTGLSADAVSALSFAANQSGKELSDLQKPIVALNEKLYDAAHGNEELRESFRKMGVTDLKNVEGALDQLSKAFNDTKAGPEKLHAIVELLGKKAGPDFISVMAKMQGGLRSAEAEAARLGARLSDDDIKAAKDFSKAYSVIGYQIEVATAKFALQYAPAVTGGIKDISEWLAKNHDAWETWGRSVGNVITGVIGKLGGLAVWLQQHPDLVKFILMNNPVTAAGMGLYNYFEQAGAGGSKSSGPLWSSAHGPGSGPSPIDKFLAAMEKDSKSGGSGKIHRAPKESDDAFRKFFTDEGFSVNRTFGRAINSGSPHPYGGAADVSIAGKTAAQIFKLMADALEKGYRVVDERSPVPGIKQTGPHVHFENAKTTLSKSSIIGSGGFSPNELAYLQHLDKTRLGKASGESGMTAWLTKSAEDQKRDDDEKFRLAEAAADRLVDIGKATTDSLVGQHEREYDAFVSANNPDYAIQAAKKVHDLEVQQLDDEIVALDAKYHRAKSGSEEEAELFKQLQIKHTDYNNAVYDADKKLADRVKAIWQKQVDESEQLMEEASARFASQLDALPNDPLAGMSDQLKGAVSRGKALHAGQDGSSTHNIWDLGKVQTAHDTYGKLVGNMKDMTNQAFGSMASAVGSAIEAWALYGESIGASLKKATAAILANLAAQAITQAVWEAAQGFAMLALNFFIPNPDYVKSATAHFVSAGIYAGMGGVAAIAARGMSGSQAATSSGGGASGGSGQKSSSGGNGGSVYSSQSDMVDDRSLNAAGRYNSQRVEVSINLGLDSKGVLKLLDRDAGKRGSSRKLIQKFGGGS